MKRLLILLFLLSACHGSKFAFEPKSNFRKMNVELTTSDSKIKLNSLAYLSKDSNVLSIYGPLGINVMKVVSRFDSLTVIDIQNKKRYLARVYDASGSIYNFFNGKFGSNEKHILCTLCSLFVNNLNCRNSEAGKSMFDYKISNRNNQLLIDCNFNSQNESYLARFKISNDNINQSSSFNLAKYVNFETVYLTLQ